MSNQVHAQLAKFDNGNVVGMVKLSEQFHSETPLNAKEARIKEAGSNYAVEPVGAVRQHIANRIKWTDAFVVPNGHPLADEAENLVAVRVKNTRSMGCILVFLPDNSFEQWTAKQGMQFAAQLDEYSF